MEWMLQVVDEIDDVVCAGRQRCENVLAELGHIPVAVGAAGALAGALALGADPTLICAAGACATLAVVLKASKTA